MVGSLLIVLTFLAKRGHQDLCDMALLVPRHVESSWTGDQTCVLCIGGWILSHCTTREVPKVSLKIN